MHPSTIPDLSTNLYQRFSSRSQTMTKPCGVFFFNEACGNPSGEAEKIRTKSNGKSYFGREKGTNGSICSRVLLSSGRRRTFRCSQQFFGARKTTHFPKPYRRNLFRGDNKLNGCEEFRTCPKRLLRRYNRSRRC